MTTYTGHKYFAVRPCQPDDKLGFFRCSEKDEWQHFLHRNVTPCDDPQDDPWYITKSNCAFRLSGQELKVGLLLSDFPKGKKYRQAGKLKERPDARKKLTPAYRTSLIIDFILNAYSIFEGAGTLSFEEGVNKSGVHPKKMGKAWISGIATIFDVSREDLAERLNAELISFRDRIHQDNAQAEEKGGTDYSHMSRDETFSSAYRLQKELLLQLAQRDVRLPKNTNLALEV